MPMSTILPKAKGWIKLSPLAPQPEPTDLLALKAEIARRWPMTSLLDVLKETDVRVGFTQCFRSPTAWENLDRDTLQYRLLLTLYGLGTGAGLKRVHMGNPEVAYKDLLYIQQRFITRDALRQAIAAVVNRLFESAVAPALGGRDDGVCCGFAAFPGVGSESPDAVACAVWQAGRHDLLACGPQSGVYLLAVEDVCILGSRRDDRRRVAALHDHGSGPPVCR